MIYEGKTKTIHQAPNPDELLIRYKDDMSAFNGVKKESLQGKGALNAKISAIIFAHLAQNGIPTHFIKATDEITWLVKKSEIIMVEVIIRNIAAGGFCKKYGITEGEKLSNTIVEFCLKDDKLGDPMMNESQITAMNLATIKELEKMKQLTLQINRLMIEMFKNAGMTLVDFKLEFGRCDGQIILCDEISPDSCRLWDIKSGNKLDKDRFRQDIPDVMGAYKEVLQRLEGSMK